MRRSRLLTTCLATLLVAACSGGPEDVEGDDAPAPRDEESAAPEEAEEPAEACEQAFADAAAGDADLEATLTACADIAAFTAASGDYPEALGDVEPQVWLAEACTEASDPAVAESSLCMEVAGEGAG